MSKELDRKKIIEIENLSINYENEKVLSDVNLDIFEGDFVSIIGENGAGKTSLIKAILGLIKYNGSIKYLNGTSKNNFSYLSQKMDINRAFPATVFEVVLSGLMTNPFKFFYSKQDKLSAKKILSDFGLDGFIEKSFFDLSGGQQQKVLLARTICSGSKILFLDEPTSALDVNAKAEFYDLIYKLSKDGFTIITITHDFDTILKLSSKIVFLKESASVFENVDDFKKSDFYKDFK